CLQCYSDPLTF
nr:immunoglobulin light chain junction region [Macaca mulatta]MOY11006.1 immunoglobulin light chain junction region [Macaca mulatta]